ncbi:FKBP-type peptidyl-prolyl cis-trans isomerase [Mycolicibacterium pulveris]|uniref:FKBP-type peptidyl-prolyl cis-trans isomerase n=1 Tax=Mycolicibacterium pulveris TaxID=36813 RepID=UPI003CEEB888
MNFSSRPSSVVLAACAATFAMTLAACGSDTETTATTTSAPSIDELVAPSITESAPPAAVSACPSAPPDAAGAAEWNLTGTTGSVAVTGSTDTTAPKIDVTAPFSVTETQVQTLQAGEGPVVADSATVLVCYMGVNGRDGTVFDNSYERGAPVDFPLTGVVPGFQKAIAGQTVGSTVGVAMTSQDGYPDGQPAAGIQPGDSLIFAIKILDAAN